MLIVTILLVIGAVMIIKGSSWMTDSLEPLARKLGTSYVAVASLLVSVMLGLPEIFVSLYAVIVGHPGISLGVIIGSVICNISLMTGLSALIKPLSVDKRVVVRDGVFSFVMAIIIFLFGIDYGFTREEGYTLLILFVPYALNVWFFEHWKKKDEIRKELIGIEQEIKDIGSYAKYIRPGPFMFITGTVLLLAGAYVFSESLVQIASATGVSDIIIGLTLGAIGPSIPNIVAAVQGTMKNYTKVAITETFGSDIFTLTITLGLLAISMPFRIDTKWLYFDIPVMIAMTSVLLFFVSKNKLHHTSAVSRKEGLFLVLMYMIFLVISILYFL